MANKNIIARVQNKYDSSTNWASANPILLAGELGIESDTGLVKIGNGTGRWNTLAYINNFGQTNSGGITAVTSTDESDIQASGVPMYISTD